MWYVKGITLLLRGCPLSVCPKLELETSPPALLVPYRTCQNNFSIYIDTPSSSLYKEKGSEIDLNSDSRFMVKNDSFVCIYHTDQKWISNC